MELVFWAGFMSRCVYLSTKVLDVTACHKFFIKLQFSFLVTSALHTHPVLRYFLKKNRTTLMASYIRHRKTAETKGICTQYPEHHFILTNVINDFDLDLQHWLMKRL